MRNIFVKIKCKNGKEGKLLRVPQSEVLKKKWSPALLEVQMPHKQTEQVAFTNFFGHCVLTAFVACIKYLCSGKYAATKTEGLPYHPPELFAMCVQLFTLKWNYEGKKRKTLLLKCSALSRCSHSASFLSLSALYQPFCHGSVNAQLPAAARRAKEIDANFSLITIFH